MKILPNRAVFRDNLAIYTAYAGDFAAGEKRRARASSSRDDFATLALAFAQLGQGQLPAAAETYKTLAADPGLRGTSWSASGDGDLALFEGRFSEAVRLLEQGAAADLAAKGPRSRGDEVTSLAYTRLAQGERRTRSLPPRRRSRDSKAAEVRFLAARVFVEAARRQGRTVARRSPPSSRPSRRRTARSSRRRSR